MFQEFIGKRICSMLTENIINKYILFCLGGLLIILPVAHTTSVRAFLILSAAVLWFISMWKKSSWKIFGTPFDLPLFIYLVTILISFFTSFNLFYSFNELRGEFLTYGLLFYLTLNNLRSEHMVKILLFVFIVGSLIMSAYGIFEYFYIKGGMFFDLGIRFDSLHQGYEAFAQYLIVVLPFNILAIMYVDDIRRKGLIFVILLLNIFALYLTHTRGAWVAFWIELLLVFSLAIQRLFIKISLVVGLIGFSVLFVVIMPSSLIWHGESGISTNEAEIYLNTGNERLVMWKASLNELLKNPFNGSGYGKTTFRWRFKNRIFSGAEQAHNTFVNTATQLGVQGLIALLFVVYSIIIVNWRGYKKTKSDFKAMYFLSVMIMTVGFFIGNQFAEFYIDDTALLFWLLVGLSVALYKEDRAEEVVS